jgi:hypothetical protein
MTEGVNSSVTCLIYCKKFYKCHNVTPPSTTIKKEDIEILPWQILHLVSDIIKNTTEDEMNSL